MAEEIQPGVEDKPAREGRVAYKLMDTNNRNHCRKIEN
jgi:hypothetical protein